DLYATLLSAAGADPALWQDSDGVDQLPAWRGLPPTDTHEALHWDCGFQWAVRAGEWKLHHVDDGERAAKIRRVEHTDPGRGLRLTNVTEDQAEATDLASARPDVVERLTALHEQWRRTVGLA